MDAAASWQAFACTGNILRYLDYKQLVQLPAEHPVGDDGQREQVGLRAAALAKLEALAQTIIRTANQLSYALAGKAASTAAQAPGVWHP